MGESGWHVHDSPCVSVFVSVRERVGLRGQELGEGERPMLKPAPNITVEGT